MDHSKLKDGNESQLDEFNPGKFLNQVSEAINESCKDHLPSLQLQYLIDDYYELLDSGHLNK